MASDVRLVHVDYIDHNLGKDADLSREHSITLCVHVFIAILFELHPNNATLIGEVFFKVLLKSSP